MKKFTMTLCAAAITIIFFVWGIYPNRCDASESPFFRAIHMGGYWGYLPEFENPSLDYFRFLKRMNVNWVGIMVGLYYNDSMDSIVKRGKSFPDEVLIRLIRKFKEFGFKVYLTLAFESNEAEIAAHPVSRWQLGDSYVPSYDPRVLEQYWPWSPSHPDHKQFVENFWNTYTQNAVYYATIAQKEGVELFSLGTETDRLFRSRSGGFGPNHFKKEMIAMVEAVRSVYSGKLSYDMVYEALTNSSFFPGSDHLFEDIGLDVVGISAYFRLAETPPTSVMTVESLQTKWEEIFNNYLIPLKNRNPNKPILFLEFGYCDSVKAPFQPNSEEFAERVFIDADGNGLDDGQETQANIYKAFFSVMNNHPDIVQGAFLWGHLMFSDVGWNPELWDDA